MPFERTFVLSYMSEVTAQITVEEADGAVYARATHPRSGIVNWFHFSDISCWSEEALEVRGETVAGVLYRMARQLFGGAKSLIENWYDDPEYVFARDFMRAFVFGYWDRRLTERFK